MFALCQRPISTESRTRIFGQTRTVRQTKPPRWRGSRNDEHNDALGFMRALSFLLPRVPQDLKL